METKPKVFLCPYCVGNISRKSFKTKRELDEHIQDHEHPIRMKPELLKKQNAE